MKFAGLILIPVLVTAGIILVRHPQTQTKEIVPTRESLKPITLTFVGDIMMDRGVRNSVVKNMDGDYNALFANAGYFKEADIAFANLEGTATDEISTRTGSRFSFRMDPASVTALKRAGVDIVSFANNHVGDYSTKGFLGTIDTLKVNNLLYVGAGENHTDVTTPKIIDVRGVKVGFLAATDVGPTWLAATTTKPGILLVTDPNFLAIVTAAKAQVDVLIVSFHWGNEYSPATEGQERIAHAVVDAGADIIVGHHPHVMEKVEEYNGKLIYYSLGNFIFDQYFSEHTMRGMVATVSIDPQTKAITHTEYVSPLSRQFVPQPLIPFDDTLLIKKSFTP